MKWRPLILLLVLLLPAMAGISYMHYQSKQSYFDVQKGKIAQYDLNILSNMFELPSATLMHLSGIEKKNFKNILIPKDSVSDTKSEAIFEKLSLSGDFELIAYAENEESFEFWVVSKEVEAENSTIANILLSISIMENPFQEDNKILISNFIQSLIKPDFSFAQAITEIDKVYNHIFNENLQIAFCQTLSPPPKNFKL